MRPALRRAGATPYSTTDRWLPVTADLTLVHAIRADIAAAGDPDRAAGQQRYMKSALPYSGLTTPQLRAVLQPYLRDYRPPDRGTWQDTILALWDGVSVREEWYAAIALARHRRAVGWLDPASLGLWRHLIGTGAWWDVVDELAAHVVGTVLSDHRAAVTPTMRAWSRDEDLWIRRTAVLAQLRHGADTDVALLTDVVEANIDDPSFWLRKAIGWALRQYARTDPDWVRAFVAAHPGLSGLSRREALKHLGG